MRLGEWERTGPNTSKKEEIRVQYRSRETKRWREFGPPFSSEEKALRWADLMLAPDGAAIGVRIYRETTIVELIHNLVASEEEK